MFQNGCSTGNRVSPLRGGLNGVTTGVSQALTFLESTVSAATTNHFRGGGGVNTCDKHGIGLREGET